MQANMHKSSDLIEWFKASGKKKKKTREQNHFLQGCNFSQGKKQRKTKSLAPKSNLKQNYAKIYTFMWHRKKK